MNAIDESVSMSRDDFFRYCNDLVERSSTMYDGWVFSNNCKDVEGNCNKYLKKEQVYLNSGQTKISDNKCDCNDMDCSGACFTSESNSATFWEYHILYNPSYSVPVLYFNAWKRDGTFLTIDELYGISGDNKICLISQQEHPLLRRPFYYVHPCDTTGILQSFKVLSAHDSSKENMVNPLICWLSAIAPAVQLTLPSQYAFK